MNCENYKTQKHEAKATHRIGVDSRKARVCAACYDAIIAEAIKGKVVVWNCD